MEKEKKIEKEDLDIIEKAKEILSKNIKQLNGLSKIINEDLHYVKENDQIFECVSVVQVETDKKDKNIFHHKKLYDEKVLIKYELPKDVEIKRK